MPDMKVLTQCFPLHLENLLSSTEYHSKPKRVLLVAFSGGGGGGQCYTHTWASKPESESVVTQLCPTLCNPMKYSPPGSSVHGISRRVHWNGLPFLSPEDLPNPGTEPGSPTMQADSFPSEWPGKPTKEPASLETDIYLSDLLSSVTWPI